MNDDSGPPGSNDGETALWVALQRDSCCLLLGVADVAALLSTSSSLKTFIQGNCGGAFTIQLDVPGVEWLPRNAHLVRQLHLEVGHHHGSRDDELLQAVTAALQGASGRLRLQAFSCRGNAASAALLGAMVSRQCPLVRLDAGLHCKNAAEQAAAAAALAALTGLRSLALSAPASELLAPAVAGLCRLTFLELRDVSAARLSSLSLQLPRQLEALKLSSKGWAWHQFPTWSLRLSGLQALTSLQAQRGRGDLVFRLQQGDELPTSLRELAVDDVAAEAAGPVLAPLRQLQQLTLGSCSAAGSLAAARAARALPGLQRVRLRYSRDSSNDRRQRQPEIEAAARHQEQEAAAAAWHDLQAGVVVVDNS